MPDPKAMQQQAAGKRLQQTQAQVNEVVDIMRVNVDRVLERDQKLSELDQRAGRCRHFCLTGFGCLICIESLWSYLTWFLSKVFPVGGT